MKVAMITHPLFLKHEMGEGHPECPERLTAIIEFLQQSDIDNQLDWLEATKTESTYITQVHSKHYFEQLITHSPAQGRVQLDPDTSINKYSIDAALLGVGAGIQSADLIMQNKYSSAFALVRPPGHHAEPDRAMGFCLFNNVAITAQYLEDKYKLKRIAVIDFDVHHGNGSESYFSNKEQFLFFSSFQHPLYPNSGYANNASNIIISPLSAGSSGVAIQKVWSENWLKIIEQFEPEMILISAGFDAHKDDPLAGLNWHEQDYYWLGHQIKSIANKYCDGKMISFLEGGYNLNALAKSVESYLKGILTSS